ncbi:MAG: MBL fold metallo-hydrolase [Deltaproteobacteria bacterium]|nr:MBL fold metallo-hydrolase [Deltaproteobacteria bacterium]
MRIRNAGKVCDHLWHLGGKDSSIYLVEGDNESIIIGGGSSYIIPEVLQQFEEFSIDESKITKLLILHTHFDHIGIVPFLKRRSPKLELFASSSGWKTLDNPQIVTITNKFSRQTIKNVGMSEACAHYDIDWRDDISGRAISEGYRFDLGNIEIEIYDTPGHSPCSLSAYIPKCQALFPSDSAGIPFEDTIIIMANSDFSLYQKSLEKLSILTTDYLCSEHYGYLTGEEARTFITDSFEMAHRYRLLMETLYLRTKDVTTTALELYNTYYSGDLFDSLSPDIIQQVCRQMVKHIVKDLGE